MVLYWGIMTPNDIEQLTGILEEKDEEFKNYKDHFRKNFNLEYDRQIIFTDFYKQSTYNLIQKENRTDLTKMFINEINEVVQKFNL